MNSDIHNQVKGRRRYLCLLAFKAFYYKLRGDDTKMMTTIADGFLELGGVYVKFLQGVLLQVPIMRLWKSDKRFDVYENVPTSPIDIGSFLRANLSDEQVAQINKVSSKPFASGSFGQVYRGELQDGKDIIIKVLRPGTRQQLKQDLRLIKIISRLLAGVFTNWNVNLKTLVKQFVKSTMAEADYVAEASFADSLYNYYKNSHTIVIPKTFLDLSSDSVIVQEYVGGISLAQLLRDNQVHHIDYTKVVFDSMGSDIKTQLSQLGIELNKAVLNGGPIHGDPHPGNIRLLPNNKIALLDFGIQTRPLTSPNAYYGVLKEFWQAEYLNKPNPGNMFVAYIRFYSGKLYDSMQIVSEYASRRTNKPVKLDEWLVKLSNKIFDERVNSEMLLRGLDRIREGEPSTDISVDNIVNPGNRFQISVRINDGAILRTMATYLSLVTEFGYRSVVPNVYNEIVKYTRENLPQLETELKPTIKLNEAMEVVSSWLEKIASKDRVLYKQIRSYLEGY
jgi:serine/threonine protein kinase